ncbi:MAG: hypothetical protein K8R73_15960 [Clostridiales bacterium]|nr:hypothetical protein [Clostridiales bacterium]
MVNYLSWWMMSRLTYIENPVSKLVINNETNQTHFDKEIVYNAIDYSHDILSKFIDFEVDVFRILGMRNLSAFIGEIFVVSLQKFSDGRFIKNPHQDGYPDLLSMHKEGMDLWDSLTNRLDEKSPFSPFVEGGLEVKATCGAVPTPKKCAKLGTKKPSIGDTRIGLLTGYDWKAHHRETNNLIGIVWDFIDRRPMITAIFYSSDLEEEDWGNIVKPKTGGGRTTSVSIITRSGIRKMYDGWLAVYNQEQYVSFFDKYNKSNIISSQKDSYKDL